MKSDLIQLCRAAAWLMVAAALATVPIRPLEGQTPRETAGVELAINLGRFPEWTATLSGQAATSTRVFRTTTVTGVSLAVFPVRYLGIEAGVETSGIRYYGEDSGFDVWRIGLQGRLDLRGPMTPVATVGFGALSHTNAIHFRYLTGGLGARRQLTSRFALQAGIHVILSTGIETRFNPLANYTDVDLDPLSLRLGMSWKPVRFGT